MIRTPTDGILAGHFYYLQFKCPKSTSAHYRDNWSFYSTDVVPIPLTKEQSDCWQQFGSYGFFTKKSGLEYLKKVKSLVRKQGSDNIFRLAKITFLLSTEGVV